MGRGQVSPAASTVDAAQVADLVERSVPEVFRYAIRLTGGDRDLAEDLVQESCLDLVRAVRSGTLVRPETGWLIVVVRRRYLDHLRRDGREARRIDRATAGEVRTTTDPAPLVAGDAMSCLASLAADQRAALVFRYVNDLSVREVAELMDRTVAATESLLARARRELARRVEEVRHG